uniref:Uncharacterized protein n=1 Tax=Anguilla anguilla TaxID=7936 RepID=A0A0E9W782_ANGAN
MCNSALKEKNERNKFSSLRKRKNKSNLTDGRKS